VTDFIRTIESAHLFANYCKVDKLYREWITTLKSTVSVRTKDKLVKARIRYYDILKLMRVVTY